MIDTRITDLMTDRSRKGRVISSWDDLWTTNAQISRIGLLTLIRLGILLIICLKLTKKII